MYAKGYEKNMMRKVSVEDLIQKGHFLYNGCPLMSEVRRGDDVQNSLQISAESDSATKWSPVNPKIEEPPTVSTRY